MPLPENLVLQDLDDAFPAPGEGVLLKNFAIQEQEQNSWCWAAVAVSIHQFYGREDFSKQCQLATKVLEAHLSGGSCCPSKGNPDCEKKLLPGSVLTTTKNLAEPPKGPLEFSEIVDQIHHPTEGRPICCTRIGKKKAGAHIVAMTGWEVTPEGGLRVFIQNPNGPGTMYYSYDQFVNGKERRWAVTCLTSP